MSGSTDNHLTAEELRALLSYDPETGKFAWIINVWGHRRFGKTAGTRERAGYIQIQINWVFHKAHRLAWLYMTGKWPTFDIDHKDGDPSNNRWDNLREATQSQNNANQKISRRNTSGFKGVSFCRTTGRWRAAFAKHNIGRFDTPEEAHAAYLDAATKTFGEFARSK